MLKIRFKKLIHFLLFFNIVYIVLMSLIHNFSMKPNSRRGYIKKHLSMNNSMNEEFLFNINTKINKILLTHRHYSVFLAHLILNKRKDAIPRLGKEDIGHLFNSNEYYK